MLIAGAVLVGAFSMLTWRLYHTDRTLNKKITSIQKDIEKAEEQNRQLSRLVEYFSKPEHLEKEARSRFNLKKPDEEVLVIPSQVPLPSPVPTPIVTVTESRISFGIVTDFFKKLFSSSMHSDEVTNVDEN